MSDPLTLPLHDIHLPERVSLWPPAPGWWIIAGVAVLGVVAALYLYKRRKRILQSAIKLATDELLGLEEDFRLEKNPVELIRNMSALLRRLCISVYPRRETAGLTGKKWLEFLDRQSGERHFNTDDGCILLDAPYRPQVSRMEVEFLLKHSRYWIEAVSRQKAIRR